MTNPDELERAVERVEASIAVWIEKHGYVSASARGEDLRLILSALRKQRELLEGMVEAFPPPVGLWNDLQTEQQQIHARARSALTQRGDGE